MIFDWKSGRQVLPVDVGVGGVRGRSPADERLHRAGLEHIRERGHARIRIHVRHFAALSELLESAGDRVADPRRAGVPCPTWRTKARTLEGATGILGRSRGLGSANGQT